jgi:hypothetical protein
VDGPDLNKYDVHHRVVHHPRMSDAEYEQTYRDAVADLLHARAHRDRRAPHGAIPGRNPAEPARFMTMFKIMFEAEGIHPLEGGIVRMKYRRDRRYGMPIEPFGVFHYKLALETCKKLRIYAGSPGRAGASARRSRTIPSATSTWTSPLRRWSRRTWTSLRCSQETAGGERAVTKRRGEDLARAKVAARTTSAGGRRIACPARRV